ncbi:MAG: peptide deformylase [Pseudomonadota bacterium]
MALLDIITIPDPLLREASVAIERVDDDTRRLVADMFETMYDAPGIGLAAPQVGILRRVLVIDPARSEDDQPRPIAMINPELLREGETLSSYEEGCLSIPDVFAEVERPAEVRVAYTDLEGNRQELECDGLLATVVQHEIDHLDGRLFIDFLSRLRRDRILKKFVKAKRDAEHKTARL